MIKGLIFDFSGVIATDSYRVFLKDKVADLDKPYFHKLSEQVDKGIITNKQFKELLAKKVGVTSKNVYSEIFQKIVINWKLLNLINNWKKKYKICLLTNHTYPWFKKLLIKYNLSSYFNPLIISSKYKMIKPDIEIYHKSLELLKLKNNEVIFIDDRQKNVDGGENAGIKSLLFTSNEKLLEDLTKLGINLQ